MPTSNRYFDAIVIGSGTTGGWAAKELCEKGLKTLVVEKGRNIDPLKDYITTYTAPWELPYRGSITRKMKEDYYVQSRHPFDFNQATAHFWIKDSDFPYIEYAGKRFDWFRGNQLGGRSLIWGRQSYRFSDYEFSANKRDEIGIDWPIRYADLEPWYDYVESFIGVSGNKDGLQQLPDGNFLPPMELNCLEKLVQESISKNFGDRKMIIGRSANLTVPHKGRGSCMYRNRCNRGCPWGGYFSSLSSTLPAAKQTGNLEIITDRIVDRIIYDKTKCRASGVVVINPNTGKEEKFESKIVFVCASTIDTTFILLNSKSTTFPDGLGNTSGVLGHYLMDHHSSVGASGIYDGFKDRYYKGRRPNVVVVPRFRNLDTLRSDFTRGYMLNGAAIRTTWDGWQQDGQQINGFGNELNNNLTHPGPWRMWLTAYGECLPYEKNRVFLDSESKDNWGRPKISISFEYGESELAMRKDIQSSAREILELSGLRELNSWNNHPIPGASVHEMGTARMGTDPKNSFLNKFNQLHEVPNVFVTDGSCMTSSGCQNPGLTYMALTARAVNYAIEQLKNMNI